MRTWVYLSIAVLVAAAAVGTSLRSASTTTHPGRATPTASPPVVESRPAQPVVKTTAKAIVTEDLVLLALLETPDRAILKRNGTIIALGVGERTDWGQLLRIDIAARTATLAIAEGETLLALRTSEAAPTQAAPPVELATVAYESLHVRVNEALLTGEVGFGFVPLQDGLLVESEQLAYAGLRPGDVVLAVNWNSVEQMRQIGELGSILAGGRLQFDLLRAGREISVVVQQAL